MDLRSEAMGTRIGACLLGVVAFAAAAATPREIEPTAAALAEAMQGHALILLGEVHDNAAQHVLRVAALRRLLAAGARPAIALEQFDRDRQADIDRSRRDADTLIAQASGAGARSRPSQWNFDFYRPFVALALEYDLPIVATNLSRPDAMRVATGGWAAVFDAQTIRELRLESLPAALTGAHEAAVADGHCGLLSPEEVPALAHAQIARDIVMAQSIRPYLGRGVVLLAGNGHVRRDIGVRFWLPTEEGRDAISIGMLERGPEEAGAEVRARFDAVLVTDAAERPDPCRELAKRRPTRPSP